MSDASTPVGEGGPMTDAAKDAMMLRVWAAWADNDKNPEAAALFRRCAVHVETVADVLDDGVKARKLLHDQECDLARLRAVASELKVTDELLDARQRVIDLIPPCPAHGSGCLPHAEQWITERLVPLPQRRDAERMDAIDADLDGMRWVRPEGHPDGPLVELDWFVGDGGGHTYTVGATILAAIDAYLDLLAPPTQDGAA